MNEKEAIDILKPIKEKLDVDDPFFYNAVVDLEQVIEWFQRRVDLMQVAETPLNEWENANLPYVYRMGKWLQDDAHRELDAFILWDLGEYQLGTVAKQAKLSQQYLREAYKKKVVVE